MAKKEKNSNVFCKKDIMRFICFILTIILTQNILFVIAPSASAVLLILIRDHSSPRPHFVQLACEFLIPIITCWHGCVLLSPSKVVGMVLWCCVLPSAFSCMATQYKGLAQTRKKFQPGINTTSPLTLISPWCYLPI